MQGKDFMLPKGMQIYGTNGNLIVVNNGNSICITNDGHLVIENINLNAIAAYKSGKGTVYVDSNGFLKVVTS